MLQGSLEANVFRCGEIKIVNDDDLNSLTLTQLSSNRSIIDLRTEEPYADMYLNVKRFSYIRLSTTNNITIYKDTTIDGILTIGNTTINGDLTINGNLAYTGDDSYTNPEVDDLLDLKINTTGKTTINKDLASTCNFTYNGDSSNSSYTTETYNKLFLKVNQSHGEIHSKKRINGGLEASVENPLYVRNSTTHTNYLTPATFHQLIANSESWIQFPREGITDTLQTSIDSDNPYVIRASDATNVVTANRNGNVALTSNLDVGLGASSPIAKAHDNNEGSTGSLQLKARWKNQSPLSSVTTYGHVYIFPLIKNGYHLRCGNGSILFTNQQQVLQMTGLKETKKL